LSVLHVSSRDSCVFAVILQEDTAEYSASFARLTYSSIPEADPFADISDPRMYLAHALATLSQMCAPGTVPKSVALASADVNHHVSKYAAAAGVVLA
jgi:hypothetical protein